MATFIRRATASDSRAVSRICLLTGNAGESAAHQHTFGELPGLVYAEPYVQLPSAAGFVMVDPKPSSEGLGGEGEGEVVGYILTAFDTLSFEQELEETWFPRWRAKYPNPYPTNDNSGTTDGTPATDTPPKPLPADTRYIAVIHNPHHASPASLAFSPAHLHIDILPAYQRRGWGRKLIGTLVRWLEHEKGLQGVWLGMDVRNEDAAKFYKRLGFAPIEARRRGLWG
ncbi:hypothetical protein EUX98_g588 [Antrodiella citrinella]|uniref:N-acetyltransferase domain-containing protein n=1 Tax=Antrodiella citrinella TaxID=2447956 RepID=A0A4S4N6Q9_9APHY|nr:hypothetical protein EUX98_g588 [Antrodiella citrinella]